MDLIIGVFNFAFNFVYYTHSIVADLQSHIDKGLQARK